MTPSEAFAIYGGEGGGRSGSSRKLRSLRNQAVRSRCAADLLLKNFGSSAAARKRESVQDFYLQMEHCEQMRDETESEVSSEAEDVEKGSNISASKVLWHF